MSKWVYSFGAGHNDGRVLLEELEKTLLARHESLKPTKHVRVPPYAAAQRSIWSRQQSRAKTP